MVLLLPSEKKGSVAEYVYIIHVSISQCSILVFPVPHEGVDVNTFSRKENGTGNCEGNINDH